MINNPILIPCRNTMSHSEAPPKPKPKPKAKGKPADEVPAAAAEANPWV